MSETWPPDEVVLEVHDRYQREVVEGLNLCPFARRSRELGRVHRPILRVAHDDEGARTAAQAVADVVSAHPNAEIILLTYPVPDDHPFNGHRAFDAHLVALRGHYEALQREQGLTVFYMVAFHPEPRLPDPAHLNPDSLVPLLRRTPDPLIQCVNADVLDRVRKEAQATAHRRMVEDLQAKDPALAALFASSINPDPELSADIARSNFEAVAGGEGRDRLDALIRDIRAERDLRYSGSHGAPGD